MQQLLFLPKTMGCSSSITTVDWKQSVSILLLVTTHLQPVSPACTSPGTRMTRYRQMDGKLVDTGLEPGIPCNGPRPRRRGIWILN